MDSKVGVVKKWLSDRGFGFISSDQSPADVFFHASDVVGKLVPVEGDTVRFDLGRNRGKPCAKRIRIEGLSGFEEEWFAAVVAQNCPVLRSIAARGQDVNAINRSKEVCRRCNGSGDGQGGYSGEDLCISRRQWLCGRCEGTKWDPSSQATALRMAVQHERLESLKTLIELRADVNKQSPLLEASAKGHAQIVQTLLQEGADPKVSQEDAEPPLLVAARGGHTPIAIMLLDAGAKSNTCGMWDDYDDYGDGEVEHIPVAEIAQRSGHRETAQAIRDWKPKLVLEVHVVPQDSDSVELRFTTMGGNEIARLSALLKEPLPTDLWAQIAAQGGMAENEFLLVLPGLRSFTQSMVTSFTGAMEDLIAPKQILPRMGTAHLVD